MTNLVEDAKSIWHAGVKAVDSQRLVSSVISLNSNQLVLGTTSYSLQPNSRIFVVGAGKAGSGMARGVLSALADSPYPVSGWVNVPEDCVQELPQIRLHGARPAGINEPTEAGVQGTLEIIRILENARPEDVCICLISGGGSALLPSPVDGLTLHAMQSMTRQLSAAGANIRQLNTVRKALSRVKGGGLAQYCQQSRLSTLIISDVLGDPLDIIASGPTVPSQTTISDAIHTIHELLSADEVTVRSYLEVLHSTTQPPQSFDHCDTQIIGNLSTAVTAAAAKAESLGYLVDSIAHQQLEGFAEEVGYDHAGIFRQNLSLGGKRAYLSGGEPVVKLAAEEVRGRGGRNQQLVLAALIDQITHSANLAECMNGGVILSGGTDGEDGPTDAAGAYADCQLVHRLLHRKLDTVDHLRRNDAYTFFEQLDGLIQTGPTHTNVCDLRIVLTNPDTTH